MEMKVKFCVNCTINMKGTALFPMFGMSGNPFMEDVDNTVLDLIRGTNLLKYVIELEPCNTGFDYNNEPVGYTGTEDFRVDVNCFTLATVNNVNGINDMGKIHATDIEISKQNRALMLMEYCNEHLFINPIDLIELIEKEDIEFAQILSLLIVKELSTNGGE